MFQQAAAQDTTSLRTGALIVDTVTTPALDPVTITASLNRLNASRTGRNILVLKGGDIARLPVRSLDELLRYLPGIEVQARGPMGAQADITLRGGTFQQVLVLIDGVRVNDANTGHFSAYLPIAPSEIARIEVLKGASSAVYGSDAVGGVVHIITKTFAGMQPPAGLQLSGQVGLGEYGYVGGNIGANWVREKTRLSLGVLSNETTGRLQRGTRGFVYSKTASASIQQQLSKGWGLALRGAFDRRRFAAQNFYTAFVSDTAQETVTTWWTQAQAVKQGTRSTLRIAAGYKWLQDSFSFNRIVSSNQNKSYLTQLLVTNELQLSSATTLVIGAQAIEKTIRSNDRGNNSVGQRAVFAVVNQELTPALLIAPALRAEWNSRSRWEAVPQLNLSYRTAHWQLRASGGKTIRDADFTERFNNYGKPVVASGQRLGNPDLVAERSWSYEAGADWLGLPSIKVSGTFFQRFHRQLIDYVLTPYSGINRKENLLPNGVYAYAKNIAEVNTTGAELDFQWSTAFSAQQRLMLMAGAVWLRSRSSDSIPSFYISSHARLLTNFSVQYASGRGSVAVNGLYKSRQAQRVTSPLITPVSADYFVLNFKAEASLKQQWLWAFVQIDNVFDRRYADLLGAVMPGRWFTAGVRFAVQQNR